MITRAFIIPTGDEIKNGTVLDLDSARVLESLVKLSPEMVVTRLAPVVDVEANIVGTMERCLDAGAELIVLIGGSGGGHRFSSTLGSDYTHSAMELWLDEKVSHCIYGKNGHAEVLGLVGQTAGKAIVVENLEEVRKLDFNRDIRLYSQTTKSLDGFREIVEYIRTHIAPTATFEFHDTICRQVASRIPNIRKFAAGHDLIFFVSGKKSSNGKMLFAECLKVNPNSHLVDSAAEIDHSLVAGATSIGICGATSTPKWLMEEISEAIRHRI